MAELSKTARAAMKAGAANTTKVVVDDATLVKQYREDRAAGLWPALPKSDAVLRTLDLLQTQYQEAADLYGKQPDEDLATAVSRWLGARDKGTIAALHSAVETLQKMNGEFGGEITDLQRELTLAKSKNETYAKALADIEAVNLMQADCNSGK